jgi:hypothetical protein
LNSRRLVEALRHRSRAWYAQSRPLEPLWARERGLCWKGSLARIRPMRCTAVESIRRRRGFCDRRYSGNGSGLANRPSEKEKGSFLLGIKPSFHNYLL